MSNESVLKCSEEKPKQQLPSGKNKRAESMDEKMGIAMATI